MGSLIQDNMDVKYGTHTTLSHYTMKLTKTHTQNVKMSSEVNLEIKIELIS